MGDYYVATDGDDGGAGSIGDPWETVDYSASQKGGSNTIWLREGTYVEEVYIFRNGTDAENPTYFKNYPGEAALISGGGTLPEGDFCSTARFDELILCEGNFVTFDGIRITNTRGIGLGIDGTDFVAQNLEVDNNMGTGLILGGDRGIAQDCDIHHNSMMTEDGLDNEGCDVGEHDAGGIIVGADDCIYRRNHVHHNWGEGIIILRGSGTVEDNIVNDNWSTQIYCDHGYDSLIQRNFMFCVSDDETFWKSPGNYPASGMSVSEEAYGGSPPDGENVTIINNIVVGCGKNFDWFESLADTGLVNFVIANNHFIESYINGIEIDSGDAHSGTIIKNNVVYQSGGSGGDEEDIADDAELDCDYNAWTNSVEAGATGTNDVVGDPILAYTTRVTAAEATTVTLALATRYKLLGHSPLIDAGLAIDEVTEDYKGTSIPQGSAPDIGALESLERKVFTGYRRKRFIRVSSSITLRNTLE